MKVRGKTLSTVALAFIALVLVLQILFSNLLLGEFNDLEERFTAEDVARAQNTIEAEANALKDKVGDWAFWDPTYEYLKDGNAGYLDENVVPSTFSSMKVQIMLWFDAKKNLFHGVEYNEEKDALAPARKEIADLFRRYDLLSGADATAEHFHRGLINSSDGTIIFAALPVLPGSLDGKSRGTLIFAKWINQTLIERLASQLKFSLKTLSIPTGEPKTTEEKIISTLNTEERIKLRLESKDKIRGYGLLLDALNRPALVLSIEKPRSIYQQGVRIQSTVTLVLTVSGLIVALLLVALLEHSVIRRLKLLTTEVLKVSTSSASPHRVTSSGSDEIAQLGTGINRMLVAMSDYHTELTKSKERAEAASEAKSNFVANISHEIRTPINGILGMVQAMLNVERAPQQKNYLRMVRDSGLSLLSIINDILDFSKLEAGKFSLEQIEFSLRRVIIESVRTISIRAFEKHLELYCDIDIDTPDLIVGDPVRLRQVLVNLLGNAVKFTERGQVTLLVRPYSFGGKIAHIEFQVSDTGVGIPLEKQTALFQPFTQADDSISRKFGGTGLGLNIARQFVELMGGAITFTSIPDEGTTFRFSCGFPSITQDLILSAEGTSRLERAAVAIVSPRLTLRELATANLQRLGIQTVKIFSQIEDLRWHLQHEVESKAFDVIILDLENEPLDSGSVFREFFHELNPDPRRLMCFVRLDELSAVTSLEQLNIRHICLKPFLADQFLATVTSIVLGETPIRFREWLPSVEQNDVSIPTISQYPLRVIVADDVRTNQHVLQLLLEQSGHTVTIANSGTQVLEILKRGAYWDRPPTLVPYDLILMDAHMPGLDGIETTQLIREREDVWSFTYPEAPVLHMPIIAVTARAQVGDRETFLAAGMDDYLSKPVDPEKLFELLNAIPPQTTRTRSISSATPVAVDANSLQSKIWAAIKSVEQLRSFPHGSKADTPIINVEDLCHRFGNKGELISEMFEIFNEEVVELRERLISSVNARDLNKTKRAAHAIKGSLFNISATTAASIAHLLEQQAGEGDISWEGVDQMISDLGREIIQVQAIATSVSGSLK